MKKLSAEEQEIVDYYTQRALRQGPWVLLSRESAHLLQRLAGEPESPHESSACRVSKQRLKGWLSKIADNKFGQ